MANIECLSLSWIDGRSLPSIDTVFMLKAAASWPHRVVMGLVATANPPPPDAYAQRTKLLSSQQYRAAQGFVIKQDRVIASSVVSDPGYTPPFDKTKLASFARDLVPVKTDATFYPGEKSAISSLVSGRLHPSSTLIVPRGFVVISSQLIKFRAGPHTDKIGVDEAKSPVHVPWVWCEQALIRRGAEVRLLGRGSTFPSHAWYVGRRRVAEVLQAPVLPDANDSALSTGQPAKQPQYPAITDKATGPVSAQLFAIGPGKLVEMDVSRYVR